MSRIRVVHLVESLGRGGLEQVVETLAVGLDRERYDVAVWTLAGEGAVAERLRRRGVRVEAAGCRPRLRPAAIAELAARLEEFGAHVVHGHGWLCGALARLAGWRAGVACRVAHRHTTYENERLRHRLAETWLSRLGWNICCSEAVRERTVLELGADPLRTEVVYNGVEVERFERGRPTDRPRKRVITVASLRELKGHRVLLAALARLAHSGVDCELQLVGDGPGRAELEELTRRLRLTAQVTFLGERDDIPQLLSAADLFVLPSTGREGLGLAAIEAMAAGLPVVASDLGGLSEVVRDRHTGLLVPPGDDEALAGAIEMLLTRSRRAVAMGAAGRDRAREAFGARAMVARVENIYRRILDATGLTRSVLFLSSRGTSFGGGQAGLKMMAAGMKSRGYEPLVVVPENGGLAAELSALGIPTLLVPMPQVRNARVDRTLLAAGRLRRLARETLPQLVHVDSTRGALYALALPRRIRRVWHLRDVRPDPLDRWLEPRFDRLVAVCDEAAQQRFPGAGERRLNVIANAVPEQRAQESRDDLRAELGVGPDELMLLAVGRVEPAKGTEELLLALARMRQDALDARVFVAGDTGDEQAWRLRGLADSLGCADRFSLLGHREDVADLMIAADLLVHPSWYEAAPRVVLEAMASGLPVVASEVGGVPEILGHAGVLVPPRDSSALATALMDLANDGDRRMTLAARAKQRYHDQFTPERHLDQITRVYDELLGIRRQGKEAA